jgi:hypothetical protein
MFDSGCSWIENDDDVIVPMYVDQSALIDIMSVRHVAKYIARIRFIARKYYHREVKS